ncbi:hypothetical protein AB0C61_13140 [Streptomyces sp. NPDC048680]|uniref:hypothetical protein n=1 Tax=Streptomyces sp. NPDC048680 TaxID=3155492 RepID=UPI003434AA7D
MASVAAAATALATGLVLAGPVSSASAAPDVYFITYTYTDGSARVEVFNNGDFAGHGSWAANPGSFGSSTGDTLIAYDGLADGYGIEATLNDGRKATSRGHSSPYTDTTTGNLDEGATRTLKVCLVKGTFSKCRTGVGVHA